MIRWRPAVLLAAVVLIVGLARPAHARPKTDVVVLKNGDRVTCEIKSLNRGKLQVKTDDMGTIDIEWGKVESVTSSGLFEIEDLLGRLYYGPLETIPEKGLEVAAATGIETVPLDIIARLMPYEATFWSRLSGSFNLGFAYTKSSDLAEFSSDFSVKYRQPTFSAELKGSSLIQRQTDVSETTRNTASFIYTRAFENRRFAFGRVSADQNRELGYDLRAGLAAAWGKYLVRSQSHELPLAAGLSLNREVPGDGETVNNLEALFAIDWASFSYDFPKTDVEILSLFYLGLTDWGRYRFDVDVQISRELFSDFTFVVKGYYNYDSNPPTEGASREDYQLTLGVGYTF